MKDILELPPKLGFTFKFINDFNISDIFNYLNESSIEWNTIPTNVDSYPFYRESMSLPIVTINSTGSKGELPIVFSIYSQDKKLIELVKPIMDNLANKYNGQVIRSLFIKLPSYGKILPVKDVFPYTRVLRRFYIPVKSNDSIYFRVDKDTKRLKPGECWEVNNNSINATWNISFDDLVYFIVDILPEEYFEK